MMKATQKFKALIKLDRTSILFAYLIPVALVIWFITIFGVDVPFWDDWSLVDLFNKVSEGNASFRDYFAQHNEHRIFLPKIIFVILAFASKWNLKLQMYLSVFLTIITCWLIYKISEANQIKNRSLFHIFNILTCFWLFSLVQAENWLWGFQLAWFLVNSLLVLAVFLLTVPNNLPPNVRFYGAALCCLLASFSLAHGLLSWLAVIPSILSFSGQAITRKLKLRVFLWLILFILFCFIYSIDFHKVGHYPDLLFFLKEPLASFNYFLRILISPIVINPINPGKIKPLFFGGLFILSCFIFFNIYYFKEYNSKFATKAAPWLSIGWFTILFALLTVIGRSGFGVEQAMESRYTTMSILLIISCLQIWLLFVEQGTSQWVGKTYRYLSCYVLTGILLVFWLSNSWNVIASTQKTWQDRHRSKSCLEIINFLLDESYDQGFDTSHPSSSEFLKLKGCLHYTYPDFTQLKNIYSSLEKLDFRHPLKHINFIDKFSENYGEIEQPITTDKPIILSSNNSLKIEGWASLPEEDFQFPELVLLSYDNKRSFFANAKIIKYTKPKNRVEWQAEILSQFIPANVMRIKAWVYDRGHKQFVKLQGEVKVAVLKN